MRHNQLGKIFNIYAVTRTHTHYFYSFSHSSSPYR